MKTHIRHARVPTAKQAIHSPPRMHINDHIGYIRVSTPKQGMQGVSLQEQKSSISEYAERHGLSIGLWLEDQETAAKQGRKEFMQAVKLLRKGEYRGMIVHKLDRGARNLKDWNEIVELSDLGVNIHFAHDSLDLHTRGGRLAADIQAVVAADFIRNLRDEARKGFYGRLKQGVYPLPAPIGYRNEGKGKPKSIDPIMGPLVKKAFELYATAGYNLETLAEEMHGLGLRNWKGGRVSVTGFSTMLNNPFYIGIIRIKKTNETFPGAHKQLIPKSVFDRVHRILTRKANTKVQRHVFEFRRLLLCAQCKKTLIGERQKGHVYYRCHTKSCPTKAIREEVVQQSVSDLLLHFLFNDEERAYFRRKLLSLQQTWAQNRDEQLHSMKLQLDQTKDRLNRLTDAFLEQSLDKEMYNERKKSILMESAGIEENIKRLNSRMARGHERVGDFLELVNNASLSYQSAFPEERREMIDVLTSNRTVNGKEVVVEPSVPCTAIARRSKIAYGAPKRGIGRMWDSIIEQLLTLNTAGQLPDLRACSGFTVNGESG